MINPEKNEKKAIKELQVGDRVAEIFKVAQASKRNRKDGEPYLILELIDRNGRTAAKSWDRADEYYRMIREGELYHITGQINEYQGKREIKVTGIRELSSEEKLKNVDEFTEKPAFDVSAMFEEMMAILKKNVDHPQAVQLIELFAKNFREPFQLHYGAQKIHHAYVGGLLKHTMNIVQLANEIADQYSLNKNILLIGALFHDIGKIREFNASPNGSTLSGGLVGHIVLGHQIFLDLVRQIPAFPEDLSLQIQHLLISHHGEREFGSPELPKTREAFALYTADLLDSKLNIFNESIQSAENKSLFSETIYFLNRRILLPQNLPADDPKRTV